MSDITRWVALNDLSKYGDVFAENELVLGDLPELTDEDILGLGLPLGPRRRVQKAIRELVEHDVHESLPSGVGDSAKS
ncbi:MAG: hypothetical protein ACI8PT_004400 [Gammaproteobacteria bacterium]